MSAMTNVGGELVSTHEQGSLSYNLNKGVLLTPVQPEIDSLDPDTVVVGERTEVTVHGSGFYPHGAIVWADDEAQPTAFVDGGTLTYFAVASSEGSQDVTARNASDLVSNAVVLTVTAPVAEEPAAAEAPPAEEPS